MAITEVSKFVPFSVLSGDGKVISYPTWRRRLVAAAILFFGFVLTLAVKVVRIRMAVGLPMWVLDALPNLICGAVIPFAILCSNRKLRMLDFFSFCGLIASGLVVYELMQIVMPKRTFAVNDLIASVAGALLAVSFGWLFFSAE